MPSALFREAMTTLAIVGGPIFLALLVVGLVVGVLQAATQVNDPAVSALPRLAAAVGACALLGGWMIERLAGFFTHAVQKMAERGF